MYEERPYYLSKELDGLLHGQMQHLAPKPIDRMQKIPRLDWNKNRCTKSPPVSSPGIAEYHCHFQVNEGLRVPQSDSFAHGRQPSGIDRELAYMYHHKAH